MIPVSRGSVRKGKVRKPKGGGSAAKKAAYIDRGGSHACRADDVLARGRSGPDLGDWMRVDRWERRKDAVVAYHVNMSLPYCLPLSEFTCIAQEHADYLRRIYGSSIKWAIHLGTGEDARNIHIHFLLTTRAVDDAGVPSKTKVALFDRYRGGKQAVAGSRGDFQDRVNLALGAAGSRDRLDLRTLRAQGIRREAQKRVPQDKYERARRGEMTHPKYERNKRLQAIKTASDAAAEIRADIAELEHVLRRDRRRTRRAANAQRLALSAGQLAFSAGQLAFSNAGGARHGRTVAAQVGGPVPGSHAGIRGGQVRDPDPGNRRLATVCEADLGTGADPDLRSLPADRYERAEFPAADHPTAGENHGDDTSSRHYPVASQAAEGRFFWEHAPITQPRDERLHVEVVGVSGTVQGGSIAPSRAEENSDFGRRERTGLPGNTTPSGATGQTSQGVPGDHHDEPAKARENPSEQVHDGDITCRVSGTITPDRLSVPDDIPSSFETVNSDQSSTQDHSETELEKDRFAAAQQSGSWPRTNADDAQNQGGKHGGPRPEIIEFSDPWGDKHYVLKAEFDLATARRAKWVKTCNPIGGSTDARQDVLHIGLVFLEFSRRRDYVVGQSGQAEPLALSAAEAELEQPEEVSLSCPVSTFGEDITTDGSSGCEDVPIADLGQTSGAYGTQTSRSNREDAAVEDAGQPTMLDEVTEPAEVSVISYTLILATGETEEYYVRHSDLAIAIQNGDANVALCQPDGSDVPDDARFKLIDLRSIRPEQQLNPSPSPSQTEEPPKPRQHTKIRR